MKTWTGSSRNLRNLFPLHLTYLTAFILPLTGCLQEGSFSPKEAVASATEPATPPQPGTSIDPTAEPSVDSDTEEALAAADGQSISTAPAKKVSTEIQVPANLKPTAATAEIIKLANAGVEERVMLSFVTNSLGTFNLRAEEIIYLNDIGVPPGVVTAMLQRDHLLQGTSSNVAVTPSETELPAANPPVYTPDAAPEQSFPAPAEAGPGQAYSFDNYTPPEPEPTATDYTDYYDALAPYGNWVDVEGSGRCWQPTVGVANHGWQPYLNCGRWVYTDCGWYWMSDYSWGWAPFHYGRWFQHASLGWCWRPDRVWGPSWVCWRHNGDYCGWAPLPPGARFVAGIGLTFHGHAVRHDFSFGLAANHFPFVPFSHFLDRNLSRHVVPHDHAARIFDHATASTGIIPHNHTVMNDGVPRDRVAAATHVTIRPAVLHNVSPSEGVGLRERFEHNGRTLAVYRPDVRPAGNESRLSSGPGRQPQAPLVNRTISSSPQASGRSEFARVPSPATQNPGVAIPTPARGNEPGLRAGRPLIVRGSDHPRQQVGTGTAANPRGVVPLNSVVVIGQNRDSRMAATQPDNWTPSSSHNRPSLSSTHDLRNSRTALRDDDSPPEVVRQPQTPAQSTWWAGQPQQPRTSNHEQLRHNRDVPNRGGGEWNGSVESSRHNSTPVHAPERVHSAPVESRQSRSAPVESHVTHSAPPVDHSSHSAPAPSSPSSSSSSHDSSSHSSSSSSSGRGR